MKTFFTVCVALLVVLWIIARWWVPASKATALFCIDEIRDPTGLATRLREAPDPLARFLQQHLSDETRALLQQWDGKSAPSFELRKHLTYDLNDILQGDPIYSPERFAGVKLPPPILRQAKHGAVGVALIFLNRHLLEQAYPTFLAPMSAKPRLTVLSWTTDPAPARQSQLAPFLALHCDLAVNVEPNTYDKNIIQCSSGVGADLIECYDNREMVTYAEAGILLNLTPYAKEYGITPDVTYPQLRGNLVYEGKQYRFPCNVGNQVLLYNKELFREAGIPEPTDDMEWGEFIERIKPLSVKRKDGYGYERFAMLIDQGSVRDIHLQFGGRFYTDDLTASAWEEPQSIEAMQFYHDLIKKYRVIPSPTEARALASTGGWGTNEIGWFAAQRAAILWGARWMMMQFRQYPSLNGKIGDAYLPHVKGRKTACYCATRGAGINRNSPHILQALEFMKYLTSEDYNRQIGLDSDGLPPNAEFASHPENLVNPKYPWETMEFHKKCVDAMEYAQSEKVSPFVDPVIVDTIWRDTIDEITNDLKTPEQALHDAAARVNDQIHQNLRDRPDLRKLYDDLKAGRIKPPAD